MPQPQLTAPGGNMPPPAALPDDMVEGEATTAANSPAAVVEFWHEAGPSRWYTKDAAFDLAVRQQWHDLYRQAVRGELASWTSQPEGSLALLLLLDQFPRNMFRGYSQAFASDALAKKIAEHAIAMGFDRAYENPWKQFFYLPFMHSEKLADQERCIALCTGSGDVEGLKFALIHHDIIARFGRFPHRNAILKRQTTPEEQSFLDAGGFAG